jgi:ribosomal protein L3 glutamine methyltransferase
VQRRKPRRASSPDLPSRTVAELIRCGESRFKKARLCFGHGLPSAYDEAAFLVLHVLKLSPATLETRLEERPSPAETRKILRLFRERVEWRKPAAYLTGEAWLGGFRFRIDENVIVPRSYIAELLSDALSPWVLRRRHVRSALDLCTGSGCLAILLAHAFPKAGIDAADISPRALRIARHNVSDYGLEERVRVIRSNLFAALAGRRYDVIVSNPPYVAAASLRRLPPEYRHEPEIALAGGGDGLDFVHAILRDADRHLNRHGWLVVETGHNRERLERAFPRTPFIWPVTSGGDDCVFVVRREDLPAGNT